jgi:hypothetical protein
VRENKGKVIGTRKADKRGAEKKLMKSQTNQSGRKLGKKVNKEKDSTKRKLDFDQVSKYSICKKSFNED